MTQNTQKENEVQRTFVVADEEQLKLLTHQERLKVQDSMHIKCLAVFSLRNGRKIVTENDNMLLPTGIEWPKDAYMCARQIHVDTSVGSVSKVFGPPYVIGTVIDKEQQECIKSKHIDLASAAHKIVLCYDGKTRGMSTETVVLSPNEVNFEK